MQPARAARRSFYTILLHWARQGGKQSKPFAYRCICDKIWEKGPPYAIPKVSFRNAYIYGTIASTNLSLGTSILTSSCYTPKEFWATYILAWVGHAGTPTVKIIVLCPTLVAHCTKSEAWCSGMERVFKNDIKWCFFSSPITYGLTAFIYSWNRRAYDNTNIATASCL